jgi:AcrR family transcriptional regulator
MREPKATDARPYHHGDLRRALVDAARRLLETEGAAALSLRAVAREAGVSPAAPYHHFKDKSELLEAVAEEGWLELSASLAKTAAAEPPDADRLVPQLLAYVRFARSQPALYRVMYESAGEREDLPKNARSGDDSAIARMRAALTRRDDHEPTDGEMELAMIAAWCAAHGLAAMAGFKQFDHLKAELGGEEPFLDAVLRQLGIDRRLPAD